MAVVQRHCFAQEISSSQVQFDLGGGWMGHFDMELIPNDFFSSFFLLLFIGVQLIQNKYELALLSFV